MNQPVSETIEAQSEEKTTNDHPLADQFDRVHDYLRISVTDRCNLKCTYCMPEDGIDYYAQSEILSYDELLRMARIFVDLGVQKIRVTGGDPFVRSGLVDFLSNLSDLRDLDTIGVTTNALLLEDKLDELKERTDLDQINVSLDSLDKEKFRTITRGGDLDTVLSAIEHAVKKGFTVKVNAVTQERPTKKEISEFVQFARELDIAVRFIEYMPLDGGRWNSDDFEPIQDLKEQAVEWFDLQPLDGESNISQTFRIPGGRGKIGFIASLSNAFCEDCNRLRLTSRGELRSCLFYTDGESVRELLRNEASDQDIVRKITETVWNKREGNPAHTGEWDPENESPPEDFALIRSIGG